MNDHPLIIAMGKALLAMLAMAAMLGIGVGAACVVNLWPYVGLAVFLILVFALFTAAAYNR
jgi:hypothetical protein